MTFIYFFSYKLDELQNVNCGEWIGTMADKDQSFAL
jgi:hypothetical protein